MQLVIKKTNFDCVARKRKILAINFVPPSSQCILKLLRNWQFKMFSQLFYNVNYHIFVRIWPTFTSFSRSACVSMQALTILTLLFWCSYFISTIVTNSVWMIHPQAVTNKLTDTFLLFYKDKLKFQNLHWNTCISRYLLLRHTAWFKKHCA